MQDRGAEAPVEVLVAESSRRTRCLAARILDVSRRRPALRSDLRRASRVPVPTQPLGELVAAAPVAESTVRLWLADHWPWTSATGSAYSVLRPRWAVAVFELAELRPLAELDAEAAVRELNRAKDPWPDHARRPIPS